MGGGTKTVRGDAETRALESSIAGAYRTAFSDLMDNNMPSVRNQLGLLDDNSLVTQALEDNVGNADRSRNEQKRSMARHGMGMTSQQRTSLEKARMRNSSASEAGNVNNARLAQLDMNANRAQSLANQGAELQSQGLGEMTQAAGLGNGRARSNAQSAADANSQNMGTAMALGSMAMMV